MRPAGRTAILCASLVFGLAHSVFAQGIASVAVRGTVSDPYGRAIDGASARVVNTATGVVVNTRVHRGRLLAQGLEVGGPYIVEIRHVGFVPLRTVPMLLALGDVRELRLTMQPLALSLDTVIVAETIPRVPSASLVSDSLVHRLPTSNRNFYDFIALVPQVSTKVGFGRRGVSAAGANMRFNAFLINGVEERAVNGSVSAANDGKSVPLDAVKEYAVLLAPYDVRYGDFAGALVNTVTRSGTNELTGSTFGYWRSDRFVRSGDPTGDETFDRMQYGFSAGGPIVRDALHFFVAAEGQRTTDVAPGPYVGQPASRVPSVPVSESDLARLETIMSRYGLSSGSGRRVENGRPLTNLFGRLDAAIPQWNSRAIGFVSDSKAGRDLFSRAALDTFSLSSYRVTTQGEGRLVSFQLHTDLQRASGGHNELTISQLAETTGQTAEVHQPLVRVRTAGTGGLPVIVNAGTAGGGGRSSRTRSIRIRDELTVPMGNDHLVTVGAQAEGFRILRQGVNGGYGIWTFANLDDLERGIAERFELRRDFGTASAPFSGAHYTIFAGDEWRVSDRLSVTMGLRADRVNLNERAPRNADIDSIFGRRTDDVPRPKIHLSPRIGFTSYLSGAGKDQLRGGIGLFTGRPPLGWFVPGRANYGEAFGFLSCGSLSSDRGAPPAFVPDHRSPPTQCVTGPAVEARPFGDVNLLDKNLRMAQSLRGSLAYERTLPWSILVTTELLATKYVSDFRWVNLNLEGPQAVDRFGRVLYGTIDSNGVPQPKLRSSYSEVIDLRNTSRNYSWQLSARVEKRFEDRVAATFAYTFSRTRDVQSPSRINLTGLTMWADARALSGRHEVQERGVSLNDLPHRVVAAFTYTAPWNRWTTGLSFYYVGESGSPFTYTATGAGRRGDLNADGSNANDPLYIPRNSLDTSEIQFVASDQASAFDRFVEKTSCLRQQRGRILARNSCREPWSHTTVASLRQSLPIRGAQFEIEADAYNVLNLLNDRWGRARIAAPRLLEHVAQTPGPLETSQAIFRFDPARSEWTTLASESVFQLQIAARYRF